MIDIKLIREQPEMVSRIAKQKGSPVDISHFLELDKSRKNIIVEIDALRQRRNEIANKIKGGKPSQELVLEGKKLKEILSEKENVYDKVNVEWLDVYKIIPNIPTNDVPVGESEEQNVVVKEWGKKPIFDFEPKNHWDIAEGRDLIDKERAAKVTGSRFAYIKGDLVKLQFAIIQYTINTLSDENIIAEVIKNNDLKLKNTAFIPILPPVMIRQSIYDQMDRLEPKEDRYHIDGDDDDLWLIGSAEHTLGSMYAGEIIEEHQLPLRYVGYSTSFRQEAGTYGKDSEGIIRMHQFDKLEMETFSTADTSLDEHMLFIALQEFMMQQLEIPYHVLMKCTADIGKPNARGVDIEAWLPGQNKYRETHTADYMTDYQSRRLNSKVRNKDQSLELVHTNDATAFALGRTMVAIIENFQSKDGKIKVPKVLQNYMGGREII